MDGKKRSNWLEPLRLAVRFLHFVELDMESVDPYVVRFFISGYPVVAPGENSNASVDKFFSARPTTVNDLVGPGLGVYHDDAGE